MDKRRSAVFGRLFSFAGILLILTFCVAFVCACDMDEVTSLFNPSEECQITFVLNNGEENVVWHKGDAVPEPKKDGHKFVGWYNDAQLTGLTGLDFENLNLSQNLVLYAKWQAYDDIVGVEFKDLEVVYDGKAHVLQVENLPDGASVVYDVENSYVDAGVYNVNATISKFEHNDLTLSATLTIRKATVSGLCFNDENVDWDGKNHSIFIDGELPSGVSVEYVGNAQSEVGKHTVTAKFSVNYNYEPIDDMSATLTIDEVYFLVKFVNGNGNEYAESVAHGCGVRNVPTLFEKDGYTASWESKNIKSVYQDTVVKAVYTPIEYTIFYYSNGDVVKEQSYTIEKETVLSAISREGYEFDGWYKDGKYSGSRYETLYKGNFGDKTFYAKWVPIEYRVKYHLGGGLNSTQNVNDGDEYVYTVESEKLVLAEPSKLHYVFEGWYANADFTGMRWYYLPKGASGDREFFAKWSPKTYTVEYLLDGGVNNSENPSEYNYESAQIQLLPATKEHYTFVCWCNETNEKVSVIGGGEYGNIKLRAKFEAVEYTIYLRDETGGDLGSIAYNVESEDITLEDQLKECYDFLGWFDESGNKVTKISANTAKDVCLYAKFEPKEYPIVCAYNGGVGENVTSYTVESADIVLNNPTREHYDFLGWYSGEEKVEIIKHGSHGKIELQARWQAKQYTIYLLDEFGKESGKIDYTIESNDIVLEDRLKEHYNFIGWFDSGGNKIVEISAKTAKDLYVQTKFEPIEYPIVYAYNGGSGDNVTSYTVESDDIILNDPQREYYEFIGWYNDEDKVEIIAHGSHGKVVLQAKWQPIVYEICYHNVDDASDYPINYTVGNKGIDLPSPSKEYYNFDGWYLNDKFDGERVEIIDATHPKNIHLYAKFTAIEYQISYELNGGEATDNPTSYTIESGDIVLKNPTREYYDFLGWFVQDNKVEIINAKTYGSIMLSAEWVAQKHTVSLYGKDGNLLKKIPFTIESDDVVLEDLNEDYYRFDGWFDESGNKVSAIASSVAENVSVYAKFTPIEYQISYNFNGGIAVDNPKTYNVESADIYLNPTSRAHCTFDGWYKDNEKVEIIKSGSHGDISLKAQWSVIDYTITYHGVESADGYVASYNINSSNVTLPTPQKDYYNFGGWFENENYSGNAVEVIDATSPKNIHLYAKFTPIEYTITYDYAGGNIVENPTSYNIESDDIVLIATNKDGSSFVGWYSGETRIAVIKKGSHGNLNLTAKWSANVFKIEYRNVDNTVGFPKEYSLEGGDVVLPSASRDYYDFVGWYESEDFSGEKVSTIKADSQKNYVLYARFSPIEYSLNFRYNGGLDAQNTSTYNIESETIVLNATSKSHYTFDGWYLGDVKIEKIEQGSHGNMTFEAKFTPIVYHVYYENAESIAHNNPTSYTVEDNDFTLLDIQKDGSTFLGWYDKQTDEKVTSVQTSLAKDITLVAKWSEIEEPQPSTPFIVDGNGILTGIDVDLLQDTVNVTIVSNVNGVDVMGIASGAFASIQSSVEQLTIQEGITTLADDLFVGMVSLKKLVLPSTIEVMYRGMLTNCASLCDLTVPYASFGVSDLTSTSATKYTKDITSGYAIGFMYLFGDLQDASDYECIKCCYQDLGKNNNTASTLSDMFYIPKSLKNVTVLGGDIALNSFKSITTVENIVLGSDVFYISDSAFMKCTGLTEVTIKGENVTLVGGVFAGCTNLTTVYVENEQVEASVMSLNSLPANLKCVVADK